MVSHFRELGQPEAANDAGVRQGPVARAPFRVLRTGTTFRLVPLPSSAVSP